MSSVLYRWWPVHADASSADSSRVFRCAVQFSQHPAFSPGVSLSDAGYSAGTDSPGLRERRSNWNPASLCRHLQSVLNRCWICRWSPALRPHHWDAHQPPLAVRVWAHTIQAGDVDLQIAARIGSAVLGRRPHLRIADMPSRHWLRSARTHRLQLPSVRHTTIGDQTFRAAGSTIHTLERPAERCRRLPDCRYIPRAAETFLFQCFFFLTFAVTLCSVYFLWTLKFFLLRPR